LVQKYAGVVRGFDGLFDQGFGILCRLGTALGQIPNLGGNDGKSQAGLPCPSRFDGSIEDQDVGLGQFQP
jgi:hypothetical protein